MDNNPDIADLSDPNRAMKLGERFSSLYDDDWTDGYQIFTEKFKLSEEAAIRLLLDILLVMTFNCYISLSWQIALLSYFDTILLGWTILYCFSDIG